MKNRISADSAPSTKSVSRRDFLKGSAALGATVVLSSLTACAAADETTAAPETAAPETSAPETSAVQTTAAEEQPTQAAATEVSALDTPLYCIDRFVTKPGDGAAFLEYFLGEYLEKAQGYGMELKSRLVSPPIWLDNASNTIELVWGIAGFNGWAAMVNASRYEPETLTWWPSVHERVLSHDRSYYANDMDLEVINNV